MDHSRAQMFLQTDAETWPESGTTLQAMTIGHSAPMAWWTGKPLFFFFSSGVPKRNAAKPQLLGLCSTGSKKPANSRKNLTARSERSRSRGFGMRAGEKLRAAIC